MASYDIEMTTDDTLELDTIIKNDSNATDPITEVETSVSYNKNDLTGIQTKTAIFDPPESGEYDIHINGQVLSINVIDASPDNVIDRYERSDLNPLTADNWGDYSGDTGGSIIQSSTVLQGNSTLELDPATTITTVRDTPYNPTEITFLIQGDGSEGHNADGNRVRIYSGSTEVLFFDLEGDNTAEAGLGKDNLGSWSDNTTYKGRLFNIDYSNNQYDAELIRVSDSTVVGSASGVGFENGVSDIDRIDLSRNTSYIGSTLPMFVDDINSQPNA